MDPINSFGDLQHPYTFYRSWGTDRLLRPSTEQCSLLTRSGDTQGATSHTQGRTSRRGSAWASTTRSPACASTPSAAASSSSTLCHSGFAGAFSASLSVRLSFASLVRGACLASQETSTESVTNMQWPCTNGSKTNPFGHVASATDGSSCKNLPRLLSDNIYCGGMIGPFRQHKIYLLSANFPRCAGALLPSFSGPTYGTHAPLLQTS